MMIVLAFLQNQWFKNPARMREILEKTYKGDRPRFVKTFLFWSCLTGKRLTAALGEDWCDRIIWEEASAEIGGKSAAAFPADPAHMLRAIKAHNPDVILTFGKIAFAGLSEVAFETAHPAARHGSLMAELRAVRHELDVLKDGFYLEEL